MQHISNKTNLIVDKDIVKINQGFNLYNNKINNFIDKNEDTISSIFDILEENPGKIQYLIVFCLTE